MPGISLKRPDKRRTARRKAVPYARLSCPTLRGAFYDA